MSLYYKRIYEHFNTSNSSKNMNKNKECNTAVDSTSICHSGGPSETLLFMNNSKISKRRENKDIQKADDELIMRFVDSLASYSSITINRYKNILESFKEFSPNLDPKDVLLYLKKKFCMNSVNTKSKTYSLSTFLKYKHLLHQFMLFNYHLPLNYYDKLNQIKINSYSSKEKVSKIEVDTIAAYNQLLSLEQYDDALLLQLLYSLSLHPNNLCMLKFDDVDKDGFIHYIDFKTGKDSKILLDDDLICFILEYVCYKGEGHKYFKKIKRTLRNGKNREGIFIVNKTYQSVYKRFLNKFGGKLKWFNYTPKEIVSINERKVHSTGKVKRSVPISRENE